MHTSERSKLKSIQVPSYARGTGQGISMLERFKVVEPILTDFDSANYSQSNFAPQRKCPWLTEVYMFSRVVR